MLTDRMRRLIIKDRMEASIDRAKKQLVEVEDLRVKFRSLDPTPEIIEKLYDIRRLDAQIRSDIDQRESDYQTFLKSDARMTELENELLAMMGEKAADAFLEESYQKHISGKKS